MWWYGPPECATDDKPARHSATNASSQLLIRPGAICRLIFVATELGLIFRESGRVREGERERGREGERERGREGERERWREGGRERGREEERERGG